MQSGARARAARVLPEARLVILELTTGAEFAVSIDTLPALRAATDEQLMVIEVLGAGNILSWPDLDADYSVPALVENAVDRTRDRGETIP